MWYGPIDVFIYLVDFCSLKFQKVYSQDSYSTYDGTNFSKRSRKFSELYI